MTKKQKQLKNVQNTKTKTYKAYSNTLESLVDYEFRDAISMLDDVATYIEESRHTLKIEDIRNIEFTVKSLRSLTAELRHRRVVEMVVNCLDLCPKLMTPMKKCVKEYTKRKVG